MPKTAITIAAIVLLSTPAMAQTNLWNNPYVTPGIAGAPPIAPLVNDGAGGYRTTPAPGIPNITVMPAQPNYFGHAPSSGYFGGSPGSGGYFGR